jgi:hypothetical protein
MPINILPFLLYFSSNNQKTTPKKCTKKHEGGPSVFLTFFYFLTYKTMIINFLGFYFKYVLTLTI